MARHKSQGCNALAEGGPYGGWDFDADALTSRDSAALLCLSRASDFSVICTNARGLHGRD